MGQKLACFSLENRRALYMWYFASQFFCSSRFLTTWYSYRSPSFFWTLLLFLGWNYQFSHLGCWCFSTIPEGGWRQLAWSYPFGRPINLTAFISGGKTISVSITSFSVLSRRLTAAMYSMNCLLRLLCSVLKTESLCLISWSPNLCPTFVDQHT